MQHEFWHQKWQKNEIGFHLNQPHPLLVKYTGSLNLSPIAVFLSHSAVKV